MQHDDMLYRYTCVHIHISNTLATHEKHVADNIHVLLGGEDAYEAFFHSGLDSELDAVVPCTRGNTCVANVSVMVANVLLTCC